MSEPKPEGFFSWAGRALDDGVNTAIEAGKKAVAGVSGKPEMSDDSVKLAAGLLQIAHALMPSTLCETDVRCELAREVLKKHGYDPEKYDEIALSKTEE